MEEILEAARDGLHGRVTALLNRDPSLVNATSEGWTPLHFAARDGHTTIVKILIEKGADVNAADYSGWPYVATPLHVLASESGYLGPAELLIANGADINGRDERGRTPLHRAVASHRDELVDLLVASGADASLKDKDGMAPLHIAADWCNRTAAGLLMTKGVDVNDRDRFGRTPLYIAAVVSVAQPEGDELVGLVDLLIGGGAHVNAATTADYGGIPAGTTPLGGALSRQRMKVAELLRQYGGTE